MSLVAPEKVEKLRQTLHAKAKESPEDRFYSLYDKLYRADVVEYAYRCCRSKGGAAGVDGQRFEDIETYGRDRWLGELTERLRRKTYRAEAVRRVYIAKADGSKRPLGIPTVTDRVVQTAAVLVLEPIFEADLEPEQYGYRPGRSAHDAIRRVRGLVSREHGEVVDADLRGYFDTIPHGKLMKSVSRRVSDGPMLALIKMWLLAPVEESDERGRKHRSNPSKKSKRGVPQGAPISPLLSNLYMRRFILGWKVLGYDRIFGSEVVAYADDLVICCRRGATQARERMEELMNRLGLTVNEAKTHVCRAGKDPFEFLGYTIERCWSSKTGRSYIGTRPSRKAIRRTCGEISRLTSRRTLHSGVEDRVERLNRLMVGWANYFCLGPVSPAYRAVDAHARERLRRWLCKKHKVQGQGKSRYPDEYLYRDLGLERLEVRTRNFSWANA